LARLNTPKGRNRLSGALGLAYALFYLYSLGDFTFYGPPAWGGYINALSWDRVFTARAPFQFEGVAVLELGYLVWLVSPLNLLIALLLSGLLAANVHGALYLSAQPQACRTGSGGVLMSALPAVMAGGACCAPSLLLLLGIPGLGALGAYFGWLVPVSLLALMVNRIWQNRRGAPPLFRWRVSRPS
jgi:hypothetical protein